jgi:hypothetical protein
MGTYVNNLRLLEITTGDESGTWGTKTNTNLELIADAFGSGTEAITTNADTHTTTIADGAADEGRAIFLKYTGTLDSACTITIAPNTVNKVWFIENATSGSQNIIISQGSGANITIGNGKIAAVLTDGAGGGAAVLDAFADLELSSTLTVAGNVDFNGALDVDGTTNLDAVDIDGAVQIDSTVTVGVDDTGYDVKFFGDTASAYMLWDTSADDLVLAGAAGIDLEGDLDVNGTTNLDAVDIDGAVQIDSTVTVGVDDTGYDVKFFGATASAYMLWDESEDDLVLAGAAGLSVDGTTDLDNTDIDGTLVVDGSNISLDSTSTLNIDNSNTSNGITIGTATSGVPISIGHSTSETTVNDNFTATGTSTLTGAVTASGGITSTAASNTLGATSFNDAAITNVGDIALDSVSSDGSTAPHFLGTGSSGATEIGNAVDNAGLFIRSKTGTGAGMAIGTTSGGDAYLQGCFNDNSGGKTIILNPYGDNVQVTGALSKGSGSFKIDHPLPSMKDTHSLVHSFTESPRADLIYRGSVALSGGSASVDLDAEVGMTDGTWELLCRDPQVYLQNEDGWSALKGSVSGSTLIISCQDTNSIDTVSWMVVAERQDEHMKESGTDWTDSDGRPILEPLKRTS